MGPAWSESRRLTGAHLTGATIGHDLFITWAYSNGIMYTDNTLTPKEAVRLCALGTLAGGPLGYSSLAESIRHFVAMVIGPSLDVMGQSIELLRYEGLIDIDQEQETVAITESGVRALHELLEAPLRMGATELNKLVITLKFRFLHLLDAEAQRVQLDFLKDFTDNELLRLSELRRQYRNDGGSLIHWLDHDIRLTEQRLVWLNAFSPGD